MTSRTEVGEKNGTGTDKLGATLVDRSNNNWTLSQAAAVAGLKTSYAVNKGGVDTAFPSGQCSFLFFKDTTIFGKRVKGGWYKWNGATWVVTNHPKDL